MINNNIGLFLKTCAKDHAWLKWCLLSIQQNAIDFAGVCIITDKDHQHIKEYDSIIKDINGQVTYLEVPSVDLKCQDGVGYIWMQNIKLLWHNYCDFDSVLQIDSDCVISSYLNSSYFIDNDRYKWFIRSWAMSQYAQIHRKPLSKIFLQDIKHEHMPYNGWLLTRQDTIDFHNWLNNQHHCSWWGYLTNQAQEDWGTENYDPYLRDLGVRQSRGSSVYNAYGGFIELTNSERYHLIDIDENDIKDYPIKQYWSWGELSETINNELQDFINSSNVKKIIQNKTIDIFDENFYIIQNPSAYLYINYIKDNINNKQKLFYHYMIFNQNNTFYLNYEEYEKDMIGQINIDTNFDHIFYSIQYPETKTYLSLCPYPIPLRKKLYHHYINHGKTFDPPFCKNAIELATQSTGIDQDIPFWFHSDRYEMLCPESESYFMPHWANIPKIYRLYHHYLNYGQDNNKILEGLQK